MLKFLKVIIGFLIWNLSYAQSTKPFFLGHSLVNFEMPNMVNRLAEASGKDYFYKLNVGNGANFSWHYTHPTTGQGDTWTTTLPEGGFTHFILTEAVPLKNHLQWSNTFEYADTFAMYAKLYNPGVKTYIYETWHCTNSGSPLGCAWDNDDDLDWRARLTTDKALWMGIVDHLKEKGHDDVYLVPGGQGLAKLYDAIGNEEVPGITSIQQVFSDDIHLTLVGNYYIACIMYATIFGESPEGLPNRLKNSWEVLYDQFPTVEQATILQKLAWQTVCENEESGVNCIVNSVEPTISKDPLIVVCNNGYVSVTDVVNKINVFNVDGKLVAHCNDCKELRMFDHDIHTIFFVEIVKGNIKQKMKLSTF